MNYTHTHTHTHTHTQWRIQDFSVGGDLVGGRPLPIILKKKLYVKTKELEPLGGNAPVESHGSANRHRNRIDEYFVFLETQVMHTTLRDLTENLSHLDRHATRLVTTAQTVNKDLEAFNKELEEERYLDNLIQTLICNGESMKYVFYPVEAEKLRVAAESQMNRDIQSPVEEGTELGQGNLDTSELGDYDEIHAQKSTSDTALFLNYKSK